MRIEVKNDQRSEINLENHRKIHVVGIGGTGMSSIARILNSMGHSVSGSDAKESTVLQSLREEGIEAVAGHDKANIDEDTDAVAISTAVSATNPEVVAASEMSCPVLSRAQMLVEIARTKTVVAIAGTHGKTTTSSLTAAALLGGGADPSWIVGGDIGGKGGARWGSGDLLVVEADESDGTFLQLGAHAAVVTNIEPDHLEHYGGWPQLQDAFVQFADAADGPVLACCDDDGVRQLLGHSRVITYGTSDNAQWRIGAVSHQNFGVSFELEGDGRTYKLRVPLPGLHNARNAAGAFGLAVTLGADPLGAAKGIEEFSGVGRRFQQRGTRKEISFVDDYAHLPTEVASAISAAKNGDWKRVVAVFQPHRYSRTEQVGRDFAHAFDEADVVVLTDVYSAGEQQRPGIDGTIVRDAVAGTGKSVTYVKERSELASTVAEILRPGDLCLSLGAGDVTDLADEVQGVI